MQERESLEHSSLLFYIKEAILAKDFVQDVLEQPLVYDVKPHQDVVRTDYKVLDKNNLPFNETSTDDGRGWCSFEYNNPGTCMVLDPETNQYKQVVISSLSGFSLPTEREGSLITVRDQHGDIMDRDWYQIDYKKGRIRYPVPDKTPPGVVASGIEPTFIDYRFHTVSVLERYPDGQNLPELPIVTVGPTGNKQLGYQIGPGVKSVTEYSVDVFAASEDGRKNICNTLKNGLYNKHVPVIDFNRTGHSLAKNGTVNKDFLKEIEINGKKYRYYLTLNKGNGNILYFFNIETSYDESPSRVGSKAVQYTGKITLTAVSFSDKDPNVIGRFSSLKPPFGGFDSLISKAYEA